jgi:hypothetical protein
MLHVAREIAKAQSEIRAIIAGMCGGGNGWDKIDLRRGGRNECEPARFVIRLAMGASVQQMLWLRQYRKLVGHV